MSQASNFRRRRPIFDRRPWSLLLTFTVVLGASASTSAFANPDGGVDALRDASDAAAPVAPVDAAVAAAPSTRDPVVAGPDVLAEPVAALAEPVVAALAPVTVSARYREENAQRVPIGITTISSEQLDSLGGTFNLKQIAEHLPSLNIQGFSGRNQTITIRGLGTNAGGTNDGLEQGVGLYVDGVYRPRTGSVITDLVDVESIQLLRGPQGTLFGKNTVAGAVDIRTLEPGFDKVVKAELSYGNYNYFRGLFSITNPVNDTLTFRLTYLRTWRKGLIYNTTYDENWDNLNNHSARADVLWKPSARFKSRLIADYSIQTGDIGFQVVKQVLPTTLANGTKVKGFYEKAADVGYAPIAVDPFARRTDIDSSQDDKMPSWGVQNRADFKLGDRLTLSSITAYRNWKWLPHYDGDQIGANVSTLGIVETHQQQVSQELRLASPGGEFLDYTGGLYYFWQEADDYQYTAYGRDASGWLISPTTPPAVLQNLVAFSHVVPATQSYAAFGQGTLNVLSTLRLTLGARLTHERKTGSYEASAQGDVAPIESLPAGVQATATARRASLAPDGSYSDSSDNTKLSGTAAVAYDVARNVVVYASYARGHKSSGINLVRKTLGVNVFVKPERVDTVELGVKTTLFGGRAEVNADVFYSRSKNYQANYVNTGVTPLAQYITNVGTLTSKGAELDARLLVVRGLLGAVSATYNDARYADYKNAVAQYLTSYLVTQDLSGRRASGAPRWTVGASAEGYVPVTVGAAKTELYGGGDFSMRTGYYAAVNLDPLSKVPRYELFGAHIGLRDESARWDLSLWVRNLFNENYYNTISVNATYGVSTAALGEPRLFGATLRTKF